MANEEENRMVEEKEITSRVNDERRTETQTRRHNLVPVVAANKYEDLQKIAGD
jgi:hypothetical protein